MFKDSNLTALGSSVGGSHTQAAAPREGEIVEGLRALNSAIDSMEGAATNITQRISPVLRPMDPTTGCNGIGSEQLTPFGLELARLRERVWAITSLIDNASGRLELP